MFQIIDIQENSLFTELTPKEAAAINGGLNSKEVGEKTSTRYKLEPNLILSDPCSPSIYCNPNHPLYKKARQLCSYVRNPCVDLASSI